MRIGRLIVVVAAAVAALDPAALLAAPELQRTRILVDDIDSKEDLERLQIRLSEFVAKLGIHREALNFVTFQRVEDPKTNFGAAGAKVLAQSWARPDVLALMWGGVRNGSAGRVAENTIFLGKIGPPSWYRRATVLFLHKKEIAYDHLFIIAYALALQAYQAEDWDLVEAIAGAVQKLTDSANRSPLAESNCVKNLPAKLQALKSKAKFNKSNPGQSSKGDAPAVGQPAFFCTL